MYTLNYSTFSFLTHYEFASIGDLEDLVKRIKPSVVFIQNRRGFRASGQGSGFVVSSSGYILTCYHVIEGAADISVRYTNGEARTSSASLVWSQKDRDIALIRASRSDTFVPIKLGDADKIGQGHQVVAIGYPLGSTLGIEPTVTTGIVSSIREFGNDSRLFQISAPVNPGNSGGALISTEIGQAIGIVNAKVQNAEGIGFAIPITDRLKRFLQGRYLN